MSYTHVPASNDEKGETASYLIALAKEQGYDHKLIRTDNHGFLVPSEWNFGADEIGEQEIVPFIVLENDIRADGPESPQRQPDVQVTVDAEGNLYLASLEVEAEAEAAIVSELPYREQVRAWAKENGYEVGERGAIKKDYYTWYEIATENAKIRAEAE